MGGARTVPSTVPREIASYISGAGMLTGAAPSAVTTPSIVPPEERSCIPFACAGSVTSVLPVISS